MDKLDGVELSEEDGEVKHIQNFKPEPMGQCAIKRSQAHRARVELGRLPRVNSLMLKQFERFLLCCLLIR